jgi:hypothetical protein
MRYPVALYVRKDGSILNGNPGQSAEINCQSSADFGKLIAREAALAMLAASPAAK